MAENENKTENNDKDKSKASNAVKPETKKMLVRYGRMGMLGWFKHKLNHISKTQKRVVIKTDRGLELGELVGCYCYKHGHFRWEKEKVSKYYEENHPGEVVSEQGDFVRYATAEDLSEEKHLLASSKQELERCEKIISDMKLAMRVVDVEHVFGGERIIFFFSSEGRVDFRELVKNLAQEFHTRIEMRQIGARDETKIISDYETCGQQCCCARFLKILKPVNMRMAKMQKATLDPTKISGYCGRLKCCLRYEDSLYKELKSKLPKRGQCVRCECGMGEVVDGQILTQLVKVRSTDGSYFAANIDEVELIDKAELNKEIEKKNSAKQAPRRQRQPRNKPKENKGQEDKPGISQEVGDIKKPAEKQDDRASNKNRSRNNRRRNNNRRNKNRKPSQEKQGSADKPSDQGQKNDS